PDVPAPHDPDPGIAGPPLTPPDTSVWGPAQRRLGADEIALQWATWREQIDDSAFATPDSGAVGSGSGGRDDAAGADGGGEASAQATDSDADVEVSGDTPAEDGAGGDGQPKHSGIRRVLAEARAYVESPPPLGRVRSSFASGDARTLRADGPGWSMVARTDDIALVLLDDEPGEVLPVGRGPELPGLLEALDAMAVRPLCPALPGAARGGCTARAANGRPASVRPAGRDREAGRRSGAPVRTGRIDEIVGTLDPFN